MLYYLRLAADAFMIVVLAGFALMMLVAFWFAIRKALKKGFLKAL